MKSVSGLCISMQVYNYMHITDSQNLKEVLKNSYLSYGGLPSALRSSKLIRCKSGCLVHNIPGPGLKSNETIRLVDKDFPRNSIGFCGLHPAVLLLSSLGNLILQQERL